MAGDFKNYIKTREAIAQNSIESEIHGKNVSLI
jgi:hypothetical protein